MFLKFVFDQIFCLKSKVHTDNILKKEISFKKKLHMTSNKCFIAILLF